MAPAVLLPEAAILLGAVAALLSGSFLPRRRQYVARLIAVAALAVAAGIAAVPAGGGDRLGFDGTYAADTATTAARLLVIGSTLLVIWLGGDELAGRARESETYALLLLSGLGAVVMAGANDLLILAVGYLLGSIPLYALVGLERSAAAAEAALKTYLLGALFGITMLLGVSVLSGLAGATAYSQLATQLAAQPPAALATGGVAVVAGLMFKAGGVPAHFWVPDAAQAASTTVAAFLTTVPKIGALVAAYRLLDALPPSVDWPLLMALLAAASMTLGNLAAFAQTDARRLLGWSTVSQVGYLLLPVAVAGRSDLALPALLLYLAAYAATNLAAFAVVAALPERRSLASYERLSSCRPWLAGALLVSLLGLVGTPPAGVFVGKLTTFAAAWDGGLPWLTVVAAVNTVASLFYYLRWLGPAFGMSSPSGAGATSGASRPYAEAAALVAAAAALLVGLGSGLVWAMVDAPLLR